MQNDDFNRIPSNISTVVDLLDTKSISWGEYQEDMPYAGYTGFNFTNQVGVGGEPFPCFDQAHNLSQDKTFILSRNKPV